VNPDFELKWISRRPADAFRRLIGKEDVRDEPEQQADEAHVQYQSVEKQEANGADPGSGAFGETEMNQGEHDA
jgi:hypothetical protein